MNSSVQAISLLLIGVWSLITAYRLQKSFKTLEERRKPTLRKLCYWQYAGGTLVIIYAVLTYLGLDDW